MTNRQIRSLAFTAALGGVCMWSVPIGAQSLGEVARREKERRERAGKASPSPAPSFTEEDLRRARDKAGPPAESMPAGDGASASGESGTGAAAAAEAERSSVESYWESRLSSARDDVERAKARVSELETAARAARGAPSATTYAEAQAEAEQRRQAIADYDAARTELAQAQRALADLEREASRGRGSSSAEQ